MFYWQVIAVDYRHCSSLHQWHQKEPGPSEQCLGNSPHWLLVSPQKQGVSVVDEGAAWEDHQDPFYSCQLWVHISYLMSVLNLGSKAWANSNQMISFSIAVSSMKSTQWLSSGWHQLSTVPCCWRASGCFPTDLPTLHAVSVAWIGKSLQVLSGRQDLICKVSAHLLHSIFLWLLAGLAIGCCWGLGSLIWISHWHMDEWHHWWGQ